MKVVDVQDLKFCGKKNAVGVRFPSSRHLGVMLKLVRRWTVNPITRTGRGFESLCPHNEPIVGINRLKIGRLPELVMAHS